MKEKAAYLRGLIEGLGIDETTKEGKVIKALIDAFDDMALTVSDLEAELDELRGPKRSIGFGNQIRSYVLYPYQMVKDLRTGYETSNVEDVLTDGNLDPFVVAYHRWRVLEGQRVADEQ